MLICHLSRGSNRSWLVAPRWRTREGAGALGRLSALDVWGVRRQPPGEPVHIDLPTEAGMEIRRISWCGTGRA